MDSPSASDGRIFASACFSGCAHVHQVGLWRRDGLFFPDDFSQFRAMCPVSKQTLHLKQRFSKSIFWVQEMFSPRRVISAGKPLLKSISTQIRAKVELTGAASGQLQRYFPMPFLIASRVLVPRKCRGSDGRRTQTGAVEIEAVAGSKSGVHGCTDSPALPQNHGPELETKSLSSEESKIAVKKPFARGQTVISPSRSGAHSESIQERRATRFGQNPLNLQTMASLLR